MTITRNGTRNPVKAPADWFTGSVQIEPYFASPSGVAGNLVTFEAGARTNWHTHPRGQALIIVAGEGRVQREGEPIEEVRPGDVVWFEPGERHWHGASPTSAMSHLAVQESVDGVPVEWQAPVTDDEYQPTA